MGPGPATQSLVPQCPQWLYVSVTDEAWKGLTVLDNNDIFVVFMYQRCPCSK